MRKDCLDRFYFLKLNLINLLNKSLMKKICVKRNLENGFTKSISLR